MLTFILSIIVVTIISLCFFKNKFWENRYLILLICGGVAFIATLTTNYTMRGKLSTKVEIISNKPLYTFYLQDTLLKDSIKSLLYVKNWDYYYDNEASEFFLDKKDTLHRRIPTHFVIYTVKNEKYVGVFDSNTSQNKYDFNNVYFASSNNDSVAYVLRKKLIYDTQGNNWLTGFSFPDISKLTILYIPSKEYNTLPDSLIRKIPY